MTSGDIPAFLALTFPGNFMTPCNIINGYTVQKTLQELRALDEGEMTFELVKDISINFDSSNLCQKILQNINISIKVDRCSISLVMGQKSDPNRCLVNQLLDVSCNPTVEQMQRQKEIRIPWGTTVAEYRQSLNISDCFKMFSRYLQHCGIDLRNAALYEKSELENKRNEVFAIFCGLGIQHTPIYERAMKSIAKTKTTFQILSNQATTLFEEVPGITESRHKLFEL
ncbi:dual 3',5'-cyclic-AMP and -GMP phosphodiesterase 11 [Caerostris extrusa]|uniref:Dual 3',5'-cyclic-AMP and -GMP phosphodiesterase 11 n=1 Tax=Caerostris extrusa TaxID=172846 RepID=A0AAV4QRG6_CAEEX|nr:dual 3',5'-cyclic-AMP and -GMP phosphodiesterase 11 [Caerostris extrusa]